MQRLNDSRNVKLVIAAHVLLTVTMAYFVTIDVDETFTLATTSQGPIHATEKAVTFELQPPLYFGILSVGRMVHESVFHARLFSVLCSALSLVVLACFVRRFLPDVTAWPVIAVAAFSPLMIFAAIEARCYAMVILLSCLLISLFTSAFMVATPTFRARAAFTMAAVASLYTFYFLGFMLAAGGVVLIAARNWRMVGHYILTMICVAACFTPLALIVNGQVESHTTTVTTTPDLVEGLRTVAWRLRNMVLPVDWEPLNGITKAVWLLLVGGITFALRGKWRDIVASPAAAIFAGYAVVVGSFVVIIQILGGDLLAERHFSLLLMPTVLVVSYGVSFAGGRRAMSCFAGIAVVCMLASLPVRYPHGAKSGDWQRVTELVMRHEERNQPVVIFTPAAARAVEHYYAGKNELVPLPHPQTSDRYAPHEFRLNSPDFVAECVRQASPHHDTLWLILDAEQFEGRGFGVEHLETFIRQGYEVESHYTLHGSTLLKCNRRTDRAVVPSGQLTAELQ